MPQTAAYKHEWYLKNKEKIIVRARNWRASNRERHRKYSQKWKRANPERVVATRRTREEATGANSARARAWAEANPEKVSANARAWRLANPEKIAVSKRTWAVANPEKMSAAQQRRRARKLGAFVEDVDHAVVFERDAGVCGICNLPVGLDAWHLDHIKPLSKGGEHSYANTQVSHPTCNQRKGDSFQLTTQTQGEQ